MKYKAMRILIFIALLLSQAKCLGQKSVDCEFIFKTQLFLEKGNVRNLTGFNTKGNDLFLFFNKNIALKFDTLESRGFKDNYYFLRLSVKNGIKYNETIMRSDTSFGLFIEDGCLEYILAINKHNGRSYRIKGFGSNDFYFLFASINEYFEREDPKKRKITIKKFVKDYQVTSVDFYCLYAALKYREYDKIKYPCLQNCDSQPIVIHCQLQP